MEGCCVAGVSFFFNAVGVLFRWVDYVAVLDVGSGINAGFIIQRDIFTGYIRSGSGGGSYYS